MKQAIALIATALFAANVGATDRFDMHQGIETPDLSPPPYTDAVKASVTAKGFDMHQGLESPDLSPPPPKTLGVPSSGGGFDMHQGIKTPDLSPPPYEK